MTIVDTRLLEAIHRMQRDLAHMERLLLHRNKPEPITSPQLVDATLQTLEAQDFTWRARALYTHIRTATGTPDGDRTLARHLVHRGWSSRRDSAGVLWTPPITPEPKPESEPA